MVATERGSRLLLMTVNIVAKWAIGLVNVARRGTNWPMLCMLGMSVISWPKV
jgi:hypothetical protein